MDCTQAQEEFAALLDGELAPEERAAVEGHLSQCSDCLRDLDGLKRVDTLYRQLSTVSAPEGIEERVRREIGSSAVLRFPRLSRPRRRLWPILAAAAGFLLIVGAVVVEFGFPAEEMKMASLDKETVASIPQALPESPAKAKVEPSADAALFQDRLQTGAASKTLARRLSDGGALERDKVVAARPLEVQSAPPSAVAGTSVAPAPPSAEFYKKPESPAGASVASEPPSVPVETKLEAPAEAIQTFGAANAPKDIAVAPAAVPAAMAESAAPPIAAETPKSLAAKPVGEKGVSKVEKVGKRVFELKDGVWYEAGYTDQDTTRLVRGSKELRKLISTHSELGKVLELGECVVFKVDEKWYRVEPRAAK